jgi:hypothetical protein
MAIYVTKPVQKEAMQFFPDQAWPDGVCRDPGENEPYYVTTIHGQKTTVVAGDFIVTEPDGVHFYPCKPDIFLDRHTLTEG